jgi:putative heme iron utilization protein
MRAKPSFSPAKTARRVLRLAATGALATLDRDGAPFASLVTVATTPQGAPILLLSRLAVHSKNLSADGRASLLLVGPGGEDGDPLAGARLTLTGRVTGRDDDPMPRRRFLARHTGAAAYADFGDFGFHCFAIEGGHLVAGFGRIADLRADAMLTDCADAGDLLSAEESAIGQMNADHAETLSLLATRLLGMPAGDWRMTGADPDGVDLGAGATRARLDFAERVTTAAVLRRALAEMAREARAG